MSTTVFEVGESAADTPLIWTSSTERLPSIQPLQGLLTHRELLTRELERLVGGVISIKQFQMLEIREGDHLRQVTIKCGAEPLVYAETLIPSKTISHHPWLIDLGDRPLGAAMGEWGSLSRGEYQYCRLAGSDHLYQRAIACSGLNSHVNVDLWARRYSLSLDSCDVQITEVFLPAVSCLQHLS